MNESSSGRQNRQPDHGQAPVRSTIAHGAVLYRRIAGAAAIYLPRAKPRRHRYAIASAGLQHAGLKAGSTEDTHARPFFILHNSQFTIVKLLLDNAGLA